MKKRDVIAMARVTASQARIIAMQLDNDEHEAKGLPLTFGYKDFRYESILMEELAKTLEVEE